MGRIATGKIYLDDDGNSVDFEINFVAHGKYTVNIDGEETEFRTVDEAFADVALYTDDRTAVSMD